MESHTLVYIIFAVNAVGTFISDKSTMYYDNDNEYDRLKNKYLARVAAKGKAQAGTMNQTIDRNAKLSYISSWEQFYDIDPLYLTYGVHSEMLDQPLRVGREKALHYKVLINTPHGRHLLLVSLLEQLGSHTWTQRCEGKLRLYLPNSLKHPEQPTPSSNACILENYVVKGRVWSRKMLRKKFDQIVPVDENFKIFSWFKESHRELIYKLADWVLDAESFGSCLSLMVVLREWISVKMYVELVILVLVGRKDTGFMLPSMETIMPVDFFDQGIIATPDSQSDFGRLGKAETPGLYIDTNSETDPAWGENWMTWSRTEGWEREWYFREDPVVNGHHSEWHRLGSVPRMGEYFYYMHEQMMARYEAERLSLGMTRTEYFLPELWNRRINDSYNPRLGENWGTREPGFIDTSLLKSYEEGIHLWIEYCAKYARGIDEGIDMFGEVLHYGLHDIGHVMISELSGTNGVMESAETALRDPIFFRWHGYIREVFNEYKNMLGPYEDEDLSFDNIRVIDTKVLSEGSSVEINTFYTYREMVAVDVNSLNYTTRLTNTSRMSIQYMRLNHRPFMWDIEICNDLNITTPAVVRIFMMPIGEEGREIATILMDHFYVILDPGTNKIKRDEMEAPHLSRSRWSLTELQDGLMNGQVDSQDFSMGGCGWPRHLNVPRGKEAGMPWTLVVMVSKVLEQDLQSWEEWVSNDHLAWSYCGVTGGVAPDSRPMGFPMDRNRNISSLSKERSNWFIGPVTIQHINI